MNSHRRWYQFSLRTMLVVMIVASAGFGYWVHWSREWIRQRHEAIEDPSLLLEILDLQLTEDQRATIEPPIAPAGLWLFGEKGVWAIYCNRRDIKRARELFPEAQIIPQTPPPSDPFAPIAP